MKKARILAALLCVMMVVCSLPMLASAAPTAAELNAAGAALGAASITPYSGLEFDFAGAGIDYTQLSGVETATNVTNAAEGLTTGATSGTWKYNPSLKWCPFNYGFSYFKAKVAEGGNLLHIAYWPVGDQYRVYLEISPTGIVSSGASNITTHVENFAPGTGYVEYIVRVVDSAQEIWAKGGSVDTWTKILTVGTWRASGYNSGYQFVGTNFVVEYAAIVNTSSTAAVDPVYVDSIEKILGVDKVTTGLNLDFTTGYEPSTEVKVDPGSVQYLENGMTFPVGTDSTWYYTPGYAGMESSTTSPLSGSTVGVVTAKLDSSDDKLLVQINNPYSTSTGRVYAFVKTTGISYATSGTTNWVYTDAAFDFGTDWFDVLFKTEADGYSMYAKNAKTSGKWIFLGKSTGYQKGRAYGLAFNATAATGVYVKSFTVYRQAGPQYDSIKDVVGSNVATAQSFVFDSNFGTNLTVTDSSNRVLGIVSPAAENYSDTNGLDLSAASESLTWKYWAFNGWQPFTNNGQNTAIMFTAKATSTENGVVQWRANDYYYRGYLNINKDSVGIVSSGTVTTYSTIAPGDGWVDYLLVPHTADLGYDLYMRSDSLTSGKWELKASCTDAWKHASNAFNSLGIQISGNVNMYKSVKLLSLTNAVAESETKPADATQLMYEETFGAAPAYANQKQTNAAVANGVITLTGSQESGSGEFVLYNGEIPKGGYAEFKVKNASTESNYFFEDGTKRYALLDIKSYGDVGGSGLYISDGGNIWRTFRIVRNSDGKYSSYTKVDGDTNWLKLNTNSAGTDLEGDAKISMIFHANANGTDNGVGVVDEIKIYGPAPSGELTLTDGYGTKEISGNTMTYTMPRALVKQGSDAKTLLFAEYNANDILVNAAYKEVAAGSDVESVLYTMKDKANTVKVFLWDALSQKNLMNAIPLTVVQ